MHATLRAYAIRSEHVDTVRSVVDAVVDELDRLIGGKIRNDNWHIKDDLVLIWPAGAKIIDIPVATII